MGKYRPEKASYLDIFLAVFIKGKPEKSEGILGQFFLFFDRRYTLPSVSEVFKQSTYFSCQNFKGLKI